MFPETETRRNRPRIPSPLLSLAYESENLWDAKLTQRAFMAWYRKCQAHGAAVIYLDFRDDYDFYSPSPDNFHYALVACMPNYPPQRPQDYQTAVLGVMPLPQIAVILEKGGRVIKEGLDYNYPYVDVRVSFWQVIQRLGTDFKGGVFLADRLTWRENLHPLHHRSLLLGAPEARRETCQLLLWQDKSPRLLPPAELELFAKVRAVDPRQLGNETELISLEEILKAMTMVVGIRRFGFNEPPRTTEELKSWWLERRPWPPQSLPLSR